MWHGRSRITALVVDRFDAWALRDRCRDQVSRTLTNEGVAHLSLDGVDDEPHRIVVSSADTQAVRAALAALSGEPGLHVSRVTESGRARSMNAPPPLLHPRDVVRVFSPQVSRAGRLLPTWALGADIEVWEELTTARPSPDGPVLPPGTLIAPRTNAYARYLLPGALRDHGARPLPALEEVNFPIDVVYTWVDANDPVWQEDFHAARADDGQPTSHASAWSPSRFTSREELRYSLRSITAFASWVRTIHIVTNGQVPPWLNLDHPQIRLVRHDDIFSDPSHLPTFNSHAIEANLHRIPDLAQHYLYFNDDVFLARPLRPEHFFTGSGLLRYFPSRIPVGDGEVSAADLPVVSAFKNGRDVIADNFGRRPTTRPRHTPHPQRKDVLQDIERVCPDLVTRTRASRFRATSDLSVAAQLQAYWAAATGRGVSAETEYEFIDITDPTADQRIERMIIRADLDCFCLNETHSDHTTLANQRVRRVLTTLLPFISPYER